MKKRPENKPDQGRRDALKMLAMGVGGLTAFPILGQAQAVASVAPAMDMDKTETDSQAAANWKPQFFDAHQNETLIVLTELILPATDTPGAKAALVNQYIDLKYTEETPENKEAILQALGWFDGRSLSLHTKPFVSLTEAQQQAILKSVAETPSSAPKNEAGVQAFELIKGLTIFGYYTSEIGLDQELRYEGDRYNVSYPGACTHPEHQS
ncbi:MAG: gluconate 2-dehydrogenase subunit 3 family protein [Acidobacteriaceae bacterium]